MIDSVCNNGEKSVRFHVQASEAERRITVEVRAYGLGDCIDKVFPAEQYGDALDFYHDLCKQIEAN